MLRKFCTLFLTLALFSGQIDAHAESLREKLKRLKEAITQPKDIQNNAVPQAAPRDATAQNSNTAAASSSTDSSSDYWQKVCRNQFGTTLVPPSFEGKSAEELVSKYFKVSTDMTKKLSEGINVVHGGSMPNMRPLVQELYTVKANRDSGTGSREVLKRQDAAYALGQQFINDPSMQNLAAIIALTEVKDQFATRRQQTGPSIVVEAKTLLVLVMLQYPDLVIDKGQPLAILSKDRMGGQSILGRTLLARFYLFGDYAEQNINTFNNMLGSTAVKVSGSGSLEYLNHFHRRGIPTFKDQTVYFALENIPNWNQRDRYIQMIQMNAQMSQRLQNRRSAAPDFLWKQTRQAYQQILEADRLMEEAIAGASSTEELQAMGQQMRREASGDANMIDVNVTVSEEYIAEMNRLLEAAPTIDEAAKEKLAKSNALRYEALGSVKRITNTYVAIALSNGSAMDGNLASTLSTIHELGCKNAVNAVRYQREAKVPEALTDIDIESEL